MSIDNQFECFAKMMRSYKSVDVTYLKASSYLESTELFRGSPTPKKKKKICCGLNLGTQNNKHCLVIDISSSTYSCKPPALYSTII